MCRVFNSILALTAIAGITGATVASRAASPAIEGVWRTVEVTMTGAGGRTIRSIQPNLTIITAKHYSHMELHSEAPRPNLADPSKATAEELRQVWGPLGAEAGSYELSREEFVTHPVISKNPAAMGEGSFTSYTYRIVGDTMWLGPQRDWRGPVPNPPTLKLIRVE